MKNIIATIAFAGLLLVTGCTAVYTNGCVTTVQNRFFGIQVTATTTASQMPQITVGAGSSLVTIYPTSTNPMYCAPFFSTATAQTTWNPFDVGITETTGAGNVTATIGGTNGTSQASVIVPKASEPHLGSGVVISK